MPQKRSARTERLRELFVERTGTETITELQSEELANDRIVVAHDGDGADGPVDRAILATGMDDVIDDPDWGGE